MRTQLSSAAATCGSACRRWHIAADQLNLTQSAMDYTGSQLFDTVLHTKRICYNSLDPCLHSTSCGTSYSLLCSNSTARLLYHSSIAAEDATIRASAKWVRAALCIRFQATK